MSDKSSSKFPLGYAEIRVFSHATENLEKVQTAVRNTLPEELRANLALQRTNLAGHHGNPITLLKAKLTDKKLLPLVLKKAGSELTVLDKNSLNGALSHHIERSNLYLRFDKQQAFSGKIRFGSNDPIHFKLHFKNKTAEQIITICKENGLLP